MATLRRTTAAAQELNRGWPVIVAAAGGLCVLAVLLAVTMPAYRRPERIPG